MNNIILIGMPSCGKSTVGVLLAKNLGYRFIDTDLVIQERYGKLLHELIAARGTDGFLKLENEVCATLKAERAVISTGGSVIYGKEAMAHLKSIGTVIYLKISYQTLATRLGDYVHRGVVLQALPVWRGLGLHRVGTTHRHHFRRSGGRHGAQHC